jgi:hypothetical protein
MSPPWVLAVAFVVAAVLVACVFLGASEGWW